MDKILLPYPTRISENEYTFLNEYEFDLIFKQKVFKILPGQNLFFEDKLQYTFFIAENENYEPEKYQIKVNQTVTCDDPSGRIIINYQDEINKIRQMHIESIGEQAEQVRLKYIDSGVGQSMTYRQCLIEAEAYLANMEISPHEIPHIVLDAATDGVTLYEKAVEVVSIFYEWNNIDAVINDKKRIAIKQVMSAGDLETMDKLAIVNWEV